MLLTPNKGGNLLIKILIIVFISIINKIILLIVSLVIVLLAGVKTMYYIKDTGFMSQKM